MKSKTRFIQLEFYTDYDTPSDYLVIVEIGSEGNPVASYTVRVPVRFTLLPHYPFIKN